MPAMVSPLVTGNDNGAAGESQGFNLGSRVRVVFGGVVYAEDVAITAVLGEGSDGRSYFAVEGADAGIPLDAMELVEEPARAAPGAVPTSLDFLSSTIATAKDHADLQARFPGRSILWIDPKRFGSILECRDGSLLVLPKTVAEYIALAEAGDAALRRLGEAKEGAQRLGILVESLAMWALDHPDEAETAVRLYATHRRTFKRFMVLRFREDVRRAMATRRCRRRGVDHEGEPAAKRLPCGSYSVSKPRDDGTREYARVGCKRWDCPSCGPKKQRQLVKAIRREAQAHGLTRFATLTLDPAKLAPDATPGDSIAHVRATWRKFRVYLQREFGDRVLFIAVIELTQAGRGHLHVLFARFIPQAWLSQSWNALGGGKVVDIRFVDVHRVTRYAAKYVAKSAVSDLPEGTRRFSTARAVKLFPPKAPEGWVLVKMQLAHIAARLAGSLVAQVDRPGVGVVWLLVTSGPAP